jgi:hypothetical protein
MSEAASLASLNSATRDRAKQHLMARWMARAAPSRFCT